MAFTNIYDVTFPPDTQLANLLGQDLRNLALNVQQRMAAISGLAANLPAIGSDAQPLNWTGLLYFTTDTSQVFQWSGTAWVDVTSFVGGGGHYKFEGSNIVPVTVANTLSTLPLQTIALGATDLNAGQTFYVDAYGVVGAVSGVILAISLNLGTQILGTFAINPSTANNQPWSMRGFFTVLTTGVTGTVTGSALLWQSSPSFGSVQGGVFGVGQPPPSVIINTTIANTLSVNAGWSTASPSNTITQSTMTCYRVG